MRKFAVWYVPTKGNFTKLVKYVSAHTVEMAEIVFLLRHGENCVRIVEIEEV
jgi:hypothetical protein